LALQSSHPDPTGEVILAEEEAVINRGIGLVNELETAFDVSGKQTEGTLLLTNRRLIFVVGGERQENIPIGTISTKGLYYADVEALNAIGADSRHFSIPIDSIVKVIGHNRLAEASGLVSPKLEVRWNEDGRLKTTEFVEQIAGRSRRKDLNDWSSVIERLKAGQQKIIALPPLPDANSLQGRILGVLGDLQEKGLFTIEGEVEQRFGVDLEPDAVEKACEELASIGLLRKVGKPEEGPFYRRVSPLGEADDVDG
jgi:hypothetical protein